MRGLLSIQSRVPGLAFSSRTRVDCFGASAAPARPSPAPSAPTPRPPSFTSARRRDSLFTPPVCPIQELPSRSQSLEEARERRESKEDDRRWDCGSRSSPGCRGSPYPPRIFMRGDTYIHERVQKVPPPPVGCAGRSEPPTVNPCRGRGKGCRKKCSHLVFTPAFPWKGEGPEGVELQGLRWLRGQDPDQFCIGSN